DVRAGDLALARGTVLGPPQIGLLAAIGRGVVRVRPRPRVVVMSTGSELVQPGDALGEGQIYDSNSFSLAAAARDAGAISYRVGAVTDDAGVLRATIEDQLIRADLLVTTGGVSVGAYDVVREALSTAGDGTSDPLAGAGGGFRADTADGSTDHTADGSAEGSAGGSIGEDDVPAGSGVDFRSLAMQPGKPQGFGTIGPDHTPLLALPGNPVSSYVSFELFVRPVIRTLMGLEDIHRPKVRAVLKADAVLGSPAGRRQFLRGAYDSGTGTVTPVGGSGSHLVAALAHADCLIVVPEADTSVEPGKEVEVVLLR
ncbi:molybdopterin molybdotransferase MoeA, partial [Streptomyces sp. NPDC004726]